MISVENSGDPRVYAMRGALVVAERLSRASMLITRFVYDRTDTILLPGEDEPIEPPSVNYCIHVSPPSDLDVGTAVRDALNRAAIGRCPRRP